MIDDEQLREALEARVGNARIPLGERARAVAIANPRSESVSTWRAAAWGRRLAVGAATLAVTIVVVAAFAQRSPAPDRAAGPSSSAQPIASGGPTATRATTPAPVEPPEPWGSLTWSAGDPATFEDTGANTVVQSAVHWRGRWIVVGYRFDLVGRNVSGHIWTSDDGRSWARADSWPDIQFDRIIASAERLTIVGAHREPDVGDTQGLTRASMWTSVDGIDWTEAPLPVHESDNSFVWDAAAGGHGWLVRIGDIEGRERWLVGGPTDGWREVAIDGGAFVGGETRDLIGTPDGWIALGMTGVDPPTGEFGDFGDPSNDRGAIWWSEDGEHWTAATVERPGTLVGSMMVVAGGVVATGDDHGGCPRCIGHRPLLWRSDDGRRWTSVDIDQGGPNGFGGSLIASDGRRGLLLDTEAGGQLRVRETVDGAGWTAVDVFLDPSMGPDARLSPSIVTVGPDAVLDFFDPSVRPEDHFWTVPQVAGAGTPPADAATQPPAPTPHDTVCEPAGQECGP